MPDSIALPLIAVIAAGLVALALVWPQGQGARSPAPFGHALAPVQTPLQVAAGAALRGPAAAQPLRKAAKHAAKRP